MSTMIICSLCGDSVAAEDYEPDQSLACPECTGLRHSAGEELSGAQSDEDADFEETEY